MTVASILRNEGQYYVIFYSSSSIDILTWWRILFTSYYDLLTNESILVIYYWPISNSIIVKKEEGRDWNIGLIDVLLVGDDWGGEAYCWEQWLFWNVLCDILALFIWLLFY